MYQFPSTVRFSEVDSDANLGLKGILNYFQDTSELQSESLAIGYDTIEHSEYFWILNSWQVVINKRPHMGDKIIAATKPHAFKGFEGQRNFLILDENEEVLVYANSIWTLMNKETLRPSKIPDFLLKTYPIEEAYPMDYAPRKIDIREIGDDEWTLDLTFTVEEHMLDVNQHMNNAQYVIIASPFVKDFDYSMLRVEYRKSALLKDTVTICHAQHNGRMYQKMMDSQGNLMTIIEYSKLA